MNAVGGDVRELAAPAPGGGNPDDIDPAISPDGDQVAFISVSQYKGTSTSNIYVVNTNGSGLHQVTRTQTTTAGVPSVIHGLAWSPNSKELAFRGDRDMGKFAPGGFHDVLGFITPAGTGEEDIALDDCANGGAIDWEGTKVLYTYGGAVQGCNPGSPSVLIRTVTASGSGVAVSGQITTLTAAKLGVAPNGAGSVRLSPDGLQVGYTTLPDTNNPNNVEFVTIHLNGTGRQAVKVYTQFGAWLWWASGSHCTEGGKARDHPREDHAPIGAAAAGVQAHVAVYDSSGHVISEAAGAWQVDNLNGASPTCSTTGLLAASSGTAAQTTTRHATNRPVNSGTAALVVT